MHIRTLFYHTRGPLSRKKSRIFKGALQGAAGQGVREKIIFCEIVVEAF
jgi:hypothetical protein